MRNIPSAELAVAYCILRDMSDKDFKAWLAGEKVPPTEFEKAAKKFLETPIEEKIADLKRRAAIRPAKTEHEQFHLDDTVYWNGTRTQKQDLPSLKEKFGEGPFRVLAMKTKHLRHGWDHPHRLTIARIGCVGNFGELGELPADLFTKKRPT